ncbi:MAG: hypothetical protein MJ247_02300 [Alphaproteobacteria bacterium]|nr:hypothetical protein [Alphaproteobacteria bacterium]
MDMNEISGPMFIKNDKGMISVFLPAFVGPIENPVITKKNETTLHFQRSSKGDIDLTNIDPEIMKELAGVSKILVIEANVAKTLNVMDKSLEDLIKNRPNDPDNNILDGIQNAYEVSIKF